MLRVLLVSLLLSSPVALATGKVVQIAVKGMVCGFCAQGVGKLFKAEPGVESADVSLEKKSVRLVLKDDRYITDARIEAILKDAGYTAEKIERP